MIDIKNPHADVLYSLKGKNIYIRIIHVNFHCFSDLGKVNAVTQTNTEIEIYGEFDDFSLSRIGLKVNYENDLEKDDKTDTFLFMVKFPLSRTQLYFFEYEEFIEDNDMNGK